MLESIVKNTLFFLFFFFQTTIPLRGLDKVEILKAFACVCHEEGKTGIRSTYITADSPKMCQKVVVKAKSIFLHIYTFPIY